MLDTIRQIIEGIIPETEEIFNHFNATPIWEIIEYPDANELRVEFTYTTPMFHGKKMRFQHFWALETQEAFVARIKAYILDCVCNFVSLEALYEAVDCGNRQAP